MNELVIAGVLDSLPAVRRFVREASEAAGLETDKAYGLGLAVDEIATNIVIHGYRENERSGDLKLRAETGGKELRLILEDTSPAFDPRSLAPPTDQLDKPLEERKVGGLGVYLALRSIDGFDYRSADGVNRCVFTARKGPAK